MGNIQILTTAATAIKLWRWRWEHNIEEGTGALLDMNHRPRFSYDLKTKMVQIEEDEWFPWDDLDKPRSFRLLGSKMTRANVIVYGENYFSVKFGGHPGTVHWPDVPEWIDDNDDDGRTHEVTEVCPHCKKKVTMIWNTDVDGFKAFCPHCGKRLMLCNECRHAEDGGDCDYCSRTDSCKHNPNADDCT